MKLAPGVIHLAQTVCIRRVNSELQVASTMGPYAKAEASARLIVAATNAGREINPETPIAAAEAMPELAQAVEVALIYLEDGAPKTAAERLSAAFAKIKEAA